MRPLPPPHAPSSWRACQRRLYSSRSREVGCVCTFERALCERRMRRRVLKSCVLCRGVYGTCSDTRGWRRRAAARRRGTHLRVLLPLQNARVGLCRTCGGVGSQPTGGSVETTSGKSRLRHLSTPTRAAACCPQSDVRPRRHRHFDSGVALSERRGGWQPHVL